MNQFVVVVPVLNKTAATLADHFVHHVLLKFGIYHPVILDDGSVFKGILSTIYKVININYDILAKNIIKVFSLRNFVGLLTRLSLLQ